MPAVADKPIVRLDSRSRDPCRPPRTLKLYGSGSTPPKLGREALPLGQGGAVAGKSRNGGADRRLRQHADVGCRAAEGRAVVAALPGRDACAADRRRPARSGLDRLLRAPSGRMRGRPRSEPETITLTRRLWQQILTVNARRQRRASPRDRRGPLGRRRPLGPARGRRRRLRGLPAPQAQAPRRCRPAAPRPAHDASSSTRRAKATPCCMVRTDRGDFILDNKVPARPALAPDGLRLRQAGSARTDRLDIPRRRHVARRHRQPLGVDSACDPVSPLPPFPSR